MPPESPANHRYEVATADAGTRLDVFIADRLSLSRIQVRRLLAQGAVVFEGRLASERDKGKLLAGGVVVEVTSFTPPADMRIVPEPDAPLTILAQGDGWIVVDKLPGVPVHPLEEGETGTLLNAVAARFPEIHGVGEGGLRSGVAHRLDVETSGALIVATTQQKWGELRQAFDRRQTRKLYRVIVAGALKGQGREVMNLVVAQHKPARVRVVEKGALPGMRRCDIEWKALETFDNATLLEVMLGTGFLHQIRVMLAHKGYPVLGDTVYGEDSKGPAPRLMLHASEIEVGDVRAASPDPSAFAEYLEELRRG